MWGSEPWRELKGDALTFPVVLHLFVLEQITTDEVIRVETARLATGCALNDIEYSLALLLSDESATVVDLLQPALDSLPPLHGRDREVWIWLQLVRLRANWDSLVEPQFYVESVLDEFDQAGAFSSVRFFSPVPRSEQGMDKYVARVDAFLEQMRLRLNRS